MPAGYYCCRRNHDRDCLLHSGTFQATTYARYSSVVGGWRSARQRVITKRHLQYIKDLDDRPFLVPVHSMPSKAGRSPEIVVQNASASNLDEDTLSELEAYEDGEVDNPLGKAVKDADYDLDREYYATEGGLDEDEESNDKNASGYCMGEPSQGKGRCYSP